MAPCAAHAKTFKEKNEEYASASASLPFSCSAAQPVSQPSRQSSISKARLIQNCKHERTSTARYTPLSLSFVKLYMQSTNKRQKQHRLGGVSKLG